MKRAILLLTAFFIAAPLLAACAEKPVLLWPDHPQNYKFHKNTAFIKVHWNLRQTDKDTAVAEGYVEPFSRNDTLYMVRLELVGLDVDGNVVSKAEGRPKDNVISSPVDASPFRIVLPLTGRETDFTITGSYYHFKAGEPVRLDPRALDTIPLEVNEPL